MPDIETSFRAFHAENPHVYATLVSLAREALRRGKRKIGAKSLWERMRWDLWLQTNDEKFKLNNNYTSRYARLIMQQETDLAGIFDTRELKTPTGDEPTPDLAPDLTDWFNGI